MRQVSSLGKGISGAGRAYWLWVSQLVDDFKTPEKNLNEMVQKGHFKSTEDAERAIKSILKVIFVSAPLIFITVLMWALSIKPESQSSIAQSSEKSIPVQSKQQSTPITNSIQPEKKQPSQSVISQPAQQAASTKVIQTADGYANLRSRPSTEVPVSSKVPNGTSVAILSEKRNDSGQLWYEVQANGQTGWIFSELITSDASASTVKPATTSSQEVSKPELFRQRFYEEVERLAGSFNVKAKYARGTMQSWESQTEGVELGYRYSCEDITQFNGDAMAAAQSAYEINQYSIPLDQLQVHYQAKFQAAEYAGCK
ncbi:SH3 domain-containing protein [Phormidesmis priestleyi]